MMERGRGTLVRAHYCVYAEVRLIGAYPMCGLRAVTSMRDDSISWLMRVRLASMPTTHDLVKHLDESASSRAEESRLATCSIQYTSHTVREREREGAGTDAVATAGGGGRRGGTV